MTLQRSIVTHLTTNRKHHSTSYIMHTTSYTTTPKWSRGRRGLLDMKNLHNNIIDKLREYFHTKAELSQFHKFIYDIDKILTPLNLSCWRCAWLHTLLQWILNLRYRSLLKSVGRHLYFDLAAAFLLAKDLS